MNSIMIVDDDAAMRMALRDNLEAEGYRVFTAASCSEAREQAFASQPDLVLLDVMLPDGDGMALCREFRESGMRQPIIMLTALGTERDKVIGLDLGTDDYVVKPFGLKELLARVRSQLRRAQMENVCGELAVGSVRVNLQAQTVLREGVQLEFSAKEFELLRYLLSHRNEVVSRDRLLRDVWRHQADIATRTVDNFIVRLRRKIEPDPARPRVLLTVHGSGYKLL